jgi:hypothetical protein
LEIARTDEPRQRLERVPRRAIARDEQTRGPSPTARYERQRCDGVLDPLRRAQRTANTTMSSPAVSSKPRGSVTRSFSAASAAARPSAGAKRPLSMPGGITIVF